MAFRTSTGDFDIKGNMQPRLSSNLVAIAWVAWLIGVLLMNVIFMNLIIAVIA